MGAMHEPIPGCLWQWCVSRGFRSFLGLGLWLWLWVWRAAGTLELWFGRGWNTGILELRHEQVVAFNAAVPYKTKYSKHIATYSNVQEQHHMQSHKPSDTQNTNIQITQLEPKLVVYIHTNACRSMYV